MSSWRRLAVVLLCLMSVAGTVMDCSAKPPLEVAVRRQQIRNDYIKFETIINALDITPGITVLDIGAGPGYASFVFAEKLGGSGKVYATDIRKEFVEYIAEEAKRRGLTNLYSRVVSGQGLDPFYGEHRYDIVFLANVYHVIQNPVEYFAKLRDLLNPGGRLVFVLYNQAPLFSADDFASVDGIRGILSEGDNGDPFIQRLSEGTRQLLSEKGNTAELVSALVEEFNRMLTDPNLYQGFYDGSYFRKEMFTASDRQLANWLLMMLKENGSLQRAPEQLDAKELRTVIMLNRLFFQSRFGEYLANYGMGAYIPAGDANRHTSKYLLVRELGAAGFKVAAEMQLSPYFDAVIMVPAAP